MDGFDMNQVERPYEPLYLGDFDGGSVPPSDDGWTQEPPMAPRNTLYDIRHFLERPFFSISHKRRDSLVPYVSRDGKLRIDVEATISGVGVATIEDAEILMYFITELFPPLMKDPSCREVTFNRCDLLRRLHRKTGGKQYEILEKGLKRLETTQVTTNMGPDGRPGEPTTFRFLDSCEWNPTRRLFTVRLSEWVAQAVISGDVLSIPDYYLDLPRGYARGLWRIARKHVGLRKQLRFEPLLDTLRSKMAAESDRDSFNHKINEIVEQDPFSDYQLTWVEDPVRKRHKVRMTFRMVPKCMSSGSPDTVEL